MLQSPIAIASIPSSAAATLALHDSFEEEDGVCDCNNAAPNTTNGLEIDVAATPKSQEDKSSSPKSVLPSSEDEELAWGAAELYKVTRDERVLKMTEQLGEMMLARQNAAGLFPYVEWFPKGDPTRITYSITAQCVVWMAKVKEALLLKAASAAPPRARL